MSSNLISYHLVGDLIGLLIIIKCREYFMQGRDNETLILVLLSHQLVLRMLSYLWLRVLEILNPQLYSTHLDSKLSSHSLFKENDRYLQKKVLSLSKQIIYWLDLKWWDEDHLEAPRLEWMKLRKNSLQFMNKMNLRNTKQKRN